MEIDESRFKKLIKSQEILKNTNQEYISDRKISFNSLTQSLVDELEK